MQQPFAPALMGEAAANPDESFWSGKGDGCQGTQRSMAGYDKRLQASSSLFFPPAYLSQTSDHLVLFSDTHQVASVLVMLLASASSALLPVALEKWEKRHRARRIQNELAAEHIERAQASRPLPISHATEARIRQEQEGYGLQKALEMPSEETNQVLFWLRHFGSGVIISLACVHLLPTAFDNLLDPCVEKGTFPLGEAFG